MENNLHPAIQRRLFRYLRVRALEAGCHFVITTHSNVVIDMFSGDDNAQILHVTHDGESANVRKVETSAHSGTILDDLDVRASDLLQTNVVVWVEGPSDRFYFRKWVELWSDGKLIEGEHFQCLPYGGSCNAHLTFESIDEATELIPALKINRHAILLADSDKEGPTDDLKRHTQRLVDEVTQVDGYAWVTAGKEVENYIPVVTLQALLGNDQIRGPNQFSDMLDYVKEKRGHSTPPAKTELAHEIVERLTKEAITQTLDLEQKLNDVCGLIRKWNRLEV